jgi:hypothetical protein
MLGQEENMGEVVDVRPDRFLREMREHGQVNTACKNARMPREELEALCQTNAEFDRAQIDCYLEFMEDAMMTETRNRLAHIRASAISAWKERHNVGS